MPKTNKTNKTDGNHVFIVILQRGWVVVGRLTQHGQRVRLSNAAVVRRWGTTKGLTELCVSGPLEHTILDPAPLGIEYHELTEIARLPCVEEKWSTYCK
jgi:hypothetical protein